MAAAESPRQAAIVSTKTKGRRGRARPARPFLGDFLNTDFLNFRKNIFFSYHHGKLVSDLRHKGGFATHRLQKSVSPHDGAFYRRPAICLEKAFKIFEFGHLV